MTKMKNGLMMFCLTVLLSCAALMMNAPTASAMSLADLQGTYRVVEFDSLWSGMGYRAKGRVISLKMEDGQLIGRVAQKDGDWEVGEEMIHHVFVDNGTVNCTVYIGSGKDVECIMRISQNGSTIRFDNSGSGPEHLWTLRRI